MNGFLERFKYAAEGAVAREDALCAFIKAEISSGRLRAGDPLPTIKELSAAAGLTFRQARGVMERLVKEKFIRTRPRVGAVVLPRDIRINCGRVVFAIPDVDASSYHVTQIADAMRKRLAAEGYAFTTVVFSLDARRRFTFLKSELSDPTDLVVVIYSKPHVRAFLREAGARCLFLYGDEPEKGSGPWIRFSSDAASEDFAAHCLRAGVKSVMQVRFDGNETPDARKPLVAAGIATSWMTIPRWDVLGRYEGITRSAYDVFMEMPREKFPDVFLFWDDFVAQGALTAFLKRGVRVPEDVKVATLSNRGLGPVYALPLTRFECDATATGEAVAGYVLAMLAKGRLPPLPAVSPQYVFGATFPY